MSFIRSRGRPNDRDSCGSNSRADLDVTAFRTMRPIKVVHISTVHNAMDPRIRLKQLRAVARAGHETVFVTGDASAVPMDDGVSIQTVRGARSGRLLRVCLAGARAMIKARSMKADIYHLHDPELLLWSWMLARGDAVIVYDIHEDYVTSVEQKSYLPSFSRRCLARAVGWLERRFSSGMSRVIAEKYYSQRFPDAQPILNYPDVSLVSKESSFDALAGQVIYTGNVTVERGAENMARLAAESADVDVVVVGKCNDALYQRMLTLAGTGRSRLTVEGVDGFVAFSVIQDWYTSRKWIAGLALFPPSEHYRKKELTKFFEYMAVGLPMIVSDFTPWRRFVEEHGVGISVDATDVGAVMNAIRWLQAHPAEGKAMGERGQQLIREELNWQLEGRKLIEFYGDLLG